MRHVVKVSENGDLEMGVRGTRLAQGRLKRTMERWCPNRLSRPMEPFFEQ